MMSAEILEKVDEVCRACTNEAGQDKAFGGKETFCFGDLHQLSSVETGVTPRQVYNS